MTDSKKTKTGKTSKVDFYVHTVIHNRKGEQIGSSIGVAFNNKNGNGWTAYLDANPIPVDGQIKLVGLVPKNS